MTANKNVASCLQNIGQYPNANIVLTLWISQLNIEVIVMFILGSGKSERQVNSDVLAFVTWWHWRLREPDI